VETYSKGIQDTVADTKDFHYTKYKKETDMELKRMLRESENEIKIIPLSLFIFIPGLEKLLPSLLVRSFLLNFSHIQEHHNHGKARRS
jgi:hypothetical protein